MKRANVAIALAFGLALAMLAGCNSGGSNNFGGGGSVAPVITITADRDQLLDPKLLTGSASLLDYTVGPTGSTFNVTVGIYNGASEVRRLSGPVPVAGGTADTAAWDGRDSSGRALNPGAYTVQILGDGGTAGTTTATRTIYIVRLGLVSMDFVTNGAGVEHDMTYYMRGATRSNSTYTATSGAQWLCSAYAGETSDVDLDTGLPRAAPPVNPSLKSPEMDGVSVDTAMHNWPVAYVRGATPRATVTLGSGATSEQPGNPPVASGFPIAGHPIRMFMRDGANESARTAALSPGGSATVTMPVALPNYVTKTTKTYTWHWEWEVTAGNWREMPGSLSTSHVFYTLLGAPQFYTSGAQYHPWVRVADQVATWIGAATDADDEDTLLTYIVQNIFLNYGLLYDTTSGASVYITFYTGWPGPGSVGLRLGNFLERSAGNIVNCTDCAATTTTFANMLGNGALQMMHIQGSYQLNYIEGIGRGWTTAIFGSSHGFSFHMVSTPSTSTSNPLVVDDCLCVDIDGNPSVADAPNAIRGWNIKRTWLSTPFGYRNTSVASGSTTLTLSNRPRLSNN